MGDVGIGISRVIVDTDGDAVGVSSSRLNVNATLKAGLTELADDTGAVGEGVLRVTVANDDNVSTKLSAIETDTSSMEGDLDYLGASVGTHDLAAATRGSQLNGQARIVDNLPFPVVSHEGDSARLNCSVGGVLFTNLTTENGDFSAIAIDEAIQNGTPGMVNVGGEYRASPTSYTDGDATILQTNVNGALNIAGTVDLGSTDNAVLDAIAASLEILDDWDDSNYANVNLNIAGTDVSANAGTMDAQTLRVTLATDDTHWGAVGAAADSDGVAHGQLRHIANSISDLATQTTLNNLNNNVNYLLHSEDAAHSSGDIGITSFAVRNDTLASLVSDDGDYACLQVNATGALYVDVADGGQLDTIIDTLETTLTAIETDQAAIEVLLTGIDADTNAIKTAVETLDNAISGSEMQVDVVAALPAGTNAIGKLAANSGVDIGDVTVTNIGDWLNINAGGVGAVVHAPATAYNELDAIMSVGVVCKDVLAAQANVTNLEYTTLLVDTQGALYTTHGMTGMVSGKNTGVDDTEAEVIVAAAPCKRIDMQASPSNTGDIWVGGSNVAINMGIKLAPGDFYSLDIDNTADVYVLATVDEEDIAFNYYT
tara:strand:+ start:87 stop:1883 length:1797 start_codon:yes stop_codon:yes gene_type:complete